MGSDVAIVGAGPAGLLTAQRVLVRNPEASVSVFEALDEPFGLVKFGVAPDHPGTKAISTRLQRVCEQVTLHTRTRIADTPTQSAALRLRNFAQIVWAAGPAKARLPEIEGAEYLLSGFDFARWANLHPQFLDIPRPLAQLSSHSARRAVIIGVGNVAIDCARLLLHGPSAGRELGLPASLQRWLGNNPIAQVLIVGRKSVGQTRFTPPELRELLSLHAASGCMRSHRAEPPPEPSAQSRDARIAHRVAAMLTQLPRKDSLDAILRAPERLGFAFETTPVRYDGQQLTVRTHDDIHSFRADVVIAATGYVPTPLPQSLQGDPRVHLAGWVRSNCRGALIDTQQTSFQLAEHIADQLTNPTTPRSVSTPSPSHAEPESHKP